MFPFSSGQHLACKNLALWESRIPTIMHLGKFEEMTMTPQTVLKTFCVIFVLIVAQIIHLMMTAPAKSHIAVTRHAKNIYQGKSTATQLVSREQQM